MADGIELNELLPVGAKPERTISLDLVFVHGLGGDAVSTWTYEASGAFWPQWVADDFPAVRVWTLGYAAKIGHLFQLGASTQLTTDELSKAIAARLRDNHIGRLPCIFVCHSLGGLIAKRLLLQSLESSSDVDAFKPDQVCAVMFLGTPHAGSELANALKLVEKIKNVSASSLMSLFGIEMGDAVKAIGSTSVLIEELQSENVNLSRLNQRFALYFAERSQQVPLRIRLFRETVGIKLGWLPTPLIVVSADSSDAYLMSNSDKAPLPVHAVHGADHRSLAKLSQRNGDVWDSLRFLIEKALVSPKAPDLEDPFRNEVAQMIFSALVNSPIACSCPQLGHAVAGEGEGARAARLATQMARADDSGLLDLMTAIRLAAESLKGARPAARPEDLGALENCAGALTLLFLRSLCEALTCDSPDQSVRAFFRPLLADFPPAHAGRYVSIITEACHAAMRRWPAKWKRGIQGQPVPAGVRLMDDLVASPPVHLGVDNHVYELALRITSEEPPLLGTAGSIPKVPTVVLDGLVNEACERMRDQLGSREGLVVYASHDASPYWDASTRQSVSEAFEGLLTFAIAHQPAEFNDLLNQVTGVAGRLQGFITTTDEVRQHLSQRHA